MKIKKIVLLLFVILIFFPQNVFANNIDLQLQQKLEQLKLEREIEEAERFKQKNENNIEKKVIIETEKKEKLIQDCKKINNIEIKGNKAISNKVLYKKVIDKYKNKCFTKENLEGLRSELSRFYIDKGYTTTVVLFDVDKLVVEHKILLVIEENKINKIIITDINKQKQSVKKNNLKSLFLFPFAKNKILNLRDIEQGLDQINRLQSNNAKMDIINNDIFINNVKSKPTNLNLSYNNSGSETNGTNQINISLNQDNILAINDNFYINYSDTLVNHNKKYSKSLYSSLSIPFGYWTFLTSYSNSKYFNIAKGNTGIDIEYSGDTDTYLNSLDKVLYRNSNYKLDTIFEYEIIDKKSKVRNTLIDNSTFKINNIKLSFNNTLNLNNAIFIIKPTIQKGLNSDKSNSNDGIAKGDYEIYKLFVYYNKYIQNFRFFYTFQFNGQYTNKTLYSSNQISIGGEGTVRSYKDTSLSGDRGFYIKNEIASDMANIANGIKYIFSFKEKNNLQNIDQVEKNNLKSLNNEEKVENFLDKLNNNLFSKTKLSFFIDYGFINDTYDDPNDIYDSKTGQMLGIGASLKYNAQYFNASITYAKGLYSSKFIEDKYSGNRKENAIWIDVGGKW